MIFQLEVNPAVPVKQERQTKSSLTNTKSDQYCSPLSGRVAEQDDYQQLPQSKTKYTGEKKKKGHRYTNSHTETEALQKSMQTHTNINTLCGL